MSQKVYILSYEGDEDENGDYRQRINVGAFSTAEKAKEAIEKLVNRCAADLAPEDTDRFYNWEVQRLEGLARAFPRSRQPPHPTREEFLSRILEKNFDREGFKIVILDLDDLSQGLHTNEHVPYEIGGVLKNPRNL